MVIIKVKRRKIIGVIATDPENGYQSNVLKGIFSRAQELGYDVAVFTTFVKASHLYLPYLKGEINIFNLINFDLIDGLIVLTLTFKYYYNNMIYNKILNLVNKKCKCPVISIDESFGDYEMIVTNDEDAFTKITDHILNVHHCTNIYFISGPEDTETSKIRIHGFEKSLKNHGLKSDKNKIFYGEFWYPNGENIARRIASGELEFPEAVICASDYIALGFINEAVKHNIKIPEEVIVTGYDSVLESKVNTPSLTTYVPPVFEIGKEATNRLVEKIENRKIEFKKEDSDQLRLRMSCGCIRANCGEREKDDFGYIIPYNEPGTDLVRFLESYMAEILTQSHTIEECMYNIMVKAYLIDDCEEYFLCLCPDWEEYSDDENNSTLENDEYGYPEKMKTTVYRCDDRVLEEGPCQCSPYTNPFFDTSVMHPRLFEKRRDESTVFYFTPVHFNGRRLGYAVARFPYDKAALNFIYRNWSRYVNNALEMIRVRNQLFIKSIRDPMTGLYNRAGMNANLGDIIRRSVLNGNEVFVIEIDMNGLKYINDNFGHPEGDSAIKTLAVTVYSICSNDDICVRSGGDEFLIIGECLYGEDVVKNRIEMIIKRLESYNSDSGKPYNVTASFGMSCAKANSPTDIDSMIQTADYRMYEDKAIFKKCRDNNITVR